MLEGDVPAPFPDVQRGRARAAAPHRAARPGRRRARVPLLRGPRRAGAAPRARGRAAAMVDLANALAAGLEPAARAGSTCRSPRGAPTTRPSSSRCGELRLHAGDGGLPRPAASGRDRRRGDAAADRARPTRTRRASASRRRAAGGGSPPRLRPRARRASRPRSAVPVADASAPGEPFSWPAGFPRIPDEEWVEQPVDAFGLHYDTVENHGWYRNLDLTVEQLAEDMRDGDVLVDYSGGTGILLDRLRLRVFDRQVGMLIVDSSPKFLRVALDRFRGDERVAFRRLHYLKDERRLAARRRGASDSQFPGADHLVSTNAIHLYDDLDGHARAAGRACSSPGGRVRINSGNLRNPRAGENEWIIDETVYVVHEVATGLVRTDPRWTRPTATCSTTRSGCDAYLAWRDRVFLAPRPLELLPRRPCAARASRSRRSPSGRSRPTSRSGTSSWPRTPTRCSAGSAARRRSTARPRRRRRRADRLALLHRGAHYDLRRTTDVPLLLDVHHRKEELTMATAEASEIRETKHFIGGEWADADGGATFEDLDPFTGDVVARVPAGDARRRASVRSTRPLRRSRRGRRRRRPSASGSSSRRPTSSRAAQDEVVALARARDRLHASASRCSRCHFVPGLFRQAAALAYAPIGRDHPLRHRARSRWASAARSASSARSRPGTRRSSSRRASIAAPLALGNTVVLKPSEHSPYVGGLLWGEIFAEAGLPAGVLNVVTHAPGEAAPIGDAAGRGPARAP